MALEEAIVFQDLFSYNNSRDLYNLLGGNTWSSDFDLIQAEEKLNSSLDIVENQSENFPYSSPVSQLMPHLEQWGCNSFIEREIISPNGGQEFPPSETSTTMPCRPKRRRSRSKKNMEDIENQRMTHIAVERNRRKQMNEYLSLLRSLMPKSYVQRVDQASIVGGAINYVKELEHQLQLLSGQNFEGGTSSSSPFAEFFSFPQYSTGSSSGGNLVATTNDPWSKENKIAAMADIEVTMVESHANLKIRSKTRPKQLIKLVNGLQSLRLTILHLSVTTVDQVALYSLCVKVEDDCNLNSGEEIAKSISQMLAMIQVEGSFSHS